MKRRKGQWQAEAPVTEARQQLVVFVEEYFRAGRSLMGHVPKASKLHEFRLLTKHVRYTLEIFRPMYGPALLKRLSLLRKVQTVLGELNDYVVTRQLLRKSADRRHPDTLTLLAYLEEQEKDRRREFASLWTERFDAPGERERWIQYLRRYARDPKSVVY